MTRDPFRFALHVSFALLFMSACDTRPHKSTPKARGIGRISEVPAAVAPKQAEEPPVSPQVQPVTNAPVVEAKEPEKKKDEPPRDFGAELTGQLTSATSCLAPRPSDTRPHSIDISVTAMVSITGRVTRGEASAGALDAKELACLRQRVEAATFAPPFEDAPFTVHATLHFQQAPQPAAATHAAPPAP